MSFLAKFKANSLTNNQSRSSYPHARFCLKFLYIIFTYCTFKREIIKVISLIVLYREHFHLLTFFLPNLSTITTLAITWIWQLYFPINVYISTLFMQWSSPQSLFSYIKFLICIFYLGCSEYREILLFIGAFWPPCVLRMRKFLFQVQQFSI